MESIFNSISDGVVVADANGAFTIFNPSAEKIVGIGPTETGPDEWSDNYGLFFPDRVTPFPPEELPLARALRGQASDEVEMFVRNPKVPDGVFISVSGRPLRDKTGTDKGRGNRFPRCDASSDRRRSVDASIRTRTAGNCRDHPPQYRQRHQQRHSRH